jgi:hypothetical protein
MLTWDLSAALAQFGLRAQQQPVGGSAAVNDAAVAAPDDSPGSPSMQAMAASGAAPSDGVNGTLSRRPSLGSILRAVSLPCNMSAGDDDPTVSPCNETAIDVKPQARRA